MQYAVTVDRGNDSEVVVFSHDGRKRRSLVAEAIKYANLHGGVATIVAPVGAGPSKVRHITEKMRRSYD